MELHVTNLHYTGGITTKLVASGGVHFRGTAPGKHSIEETWQWRRVFGDTVPDLTGPVIDLKSFRNTSDFFYFYGNQPVFQTCQLFQEWDLISAKSLFAEGVLKAVEESKNYQCVKTHRRRLTACRARAWKIASASKKQCSVDERLNAGKDLERRLYEILLQCDAVSRYSRNVNRDSLHNTGLCSQNKDLP